MKKPARDALLGAAISGLLVAGCAGAEGEGGPRIIGESHHPGLTVEGFKEMCDERGGLTQVHASCGGTNSCRGLIYNSWAGDTIVEHTCKGINSCLGISCVDLPKDSGKSAEDIYVGSCMSCHGGGHGAADADQTYTVFAAPGGDEAAALARFHARSEQSLINTVAFGAVGQFEDGTAYSNMPAYHEKLSVAEIRRVVDHLTSLNIVSEEMQILGINAEIDTSGDGH